MFSSFSFAITLLRREFQEYCNQQLGAIGLSQGLVFFLIYVGKHPDCTPNALSKTLKMDGGHTARSLTKLEQSGFLLQTPNPRDRRAHLLRLTEKGEKAFALCHNLFLQWDEARLGTLSEDERRQLMTLLQKLLTTKRRNSCVRNHLPSD